MYKEYFAVIEALTAAGRAARKAKANRDIVRNNGVGFSGEKNKVT